MSLFAALLKKNMSKKAAIKRGNELISEDIISSQSVVSAGIQNKKLRGIGGFASANSSLSTSAGIQNKKSRGMEGFASANASLSTLSRNANQEASSADSG